MKHGESEKASENGQKVFGLDGVSVELGEEVLGSSISVSLPLLPVIK
jgi:hypothetical protein